MKDCAIELSGIYGTQLKSDIIGSYYQTWWDITSGGDNFKKNLTAIVELDSATGRIYIKDTDEFIFGSSGHALNIKSTKSNTEKLNVILVEKEDEYFSCLKKNLKQFWAKINYSLYPIEPNKDWVYLLRKIDDVSQILDDIKIGISLFFFDPLLFTPWIQLEEIARLRIKNYYKQGTEFLVFLFTSDWFNGRGNWCALPTHCNEKEWTEPESISVKKCDDLFGDIVWRSNLLNSKENEEKMNLMIESYKKNLQKWFRYVLPLPFRPKTGQLYHIFVCSNYEAGLTITRTIYTKFTGNIPYSPDNAKAYKKFCYHHPGKEPKGSSKSTEWKILWRVIRNHQDGLCDEKCQDLLEIESTELLSESFEWLRSKGYMNIINPISNIWEDPPNLYQINWEFVKEKLEVSPPENLKPLTEERKKENSEKNNASEKKGPQTGLDEYL